MAIVIQFREIPCKKGSWSVEEDNKLIGYIKKRGIWNWNAMAKSAGLARTGKSCRLRWMNYLRPNLKHGNFTKEEDEVILKLHNKYGNRWTKIASKLPGRTDNDIKNYFNTRLSKKIAQNGQVLKQLHRRTSSSSSRQASSPASTSSNYNNNYYSPSSPDFNNNSTGSSSPETRQEISSQAIGEKETGDNINMGALMSNDYEGFGLDEHCFYLQGGDYTMFDNVNYGTNDKYFWYDDLFNHGNCTVRSMY